MSVEIVNNPGNVLTFKISGKLNQPELAAAQQDAAKILQQEGKKRVLVVAEGFEGWGKGDWGDLSGQMLVDQ